MSIEYQTPRLTTLINTQMKNNKIMTESYKINDMVIAPQCMSIPSMEFLQKLVEFGNLCEKYTVFIYLKFL